MMRSLFLQAPACDGFDGGAGSRYQARREIRSFWYPTWLAQAAALVPGSKLLDAVPHGIELETIAREARTYDLAVLHTSSPSFASDVRALEALKAANPALKAGFVGAKVAVDPAGSLAASPAIDFVAGNEFDFTVREIAEGRDWPRSTACPIAASAAPCGTTARAPSWRTWTGCRSSPRSIVAT